MSPRSCRARLSGAVWPGTRGYSGTRSQAGRSRSLEVRLCQFLVAVRRHDGRVQPDAGHALELPVRGRIAGIPPRRAMPWAHACRRALFIAAVTFRLLRSPSRRRPPSAPPRGRHGRDRPEQFRLTAHHPEIADHQGGVRDRACQVREDAAQVMPAQGPRAARPTGRPSGPSGPTAAGAGQGPRAMLARGVHHDPPLRRRAPNAMRSKFHTAPDQVRLAGIRTRDPLLRRHL
jgi:hypothetical protein